MPRQLSGINRALMWLRKTLEITESTESPRVLGEVLQPGIDVFGWERRVDQAVTESTTGGAAADVVVLTAVPDGIMRYVLYCDVSHDDPVAGGLLLSQSVRSGGVDIALQVPTQVLARPVHVGLERSILLQPGELISARSNPAPAAATSMFMVYRFIDLPFGEYMPPL